MPPLLIANGLCSFVHSRNLSAETRVYQSNNYTLDMNNVVDYLEFKIQTRARGHIINSSSAPVITIVVILLPFSTQVVIDVNFVSTASG